MNFKKIRLLLLINIISLTTMAWSANAATKDECLNSFRSCMTNNVKLASSFIGVMHSNSWIQKKASPVSFACREVNNLEKCHDQRTGIAYAVLSPECKNDWNNCRSSYSHCAAEVDSCLGHVPGITPASTPPHAPPLATSAIKYKVRWKQTDGTWQGPWTQNVTNPTCTNRPNGGTQCRCGNQDYCKSYPPNARSAIWPRGCNAAHMNITCEAVRQ